MIDHAWLEWLKGVLLVVRWPLTAGLIAICVFFWRRVPERNERWIPPEPAQPLARQEPDAD